jgi:hypothetical protein
MIGKPDFQCRLGDGFQIYAPYDGIGTHVLLPSRLDVAERSAGDPDFRLEILRSRTTDNSDLRGYGLLDFRVRAVYPMDEARSWLAEHVPEAELSTPQFSGGFLQFESWDTPVPVEFRKQTPLAWNGLGLSRYVIRLPLEAADWLEQRLRGANFPCFAAADVELAGIAPRLPVQAWFHRDALIGALLRRANPAGCIERNDVVEFFRRIPEELLHVSSELDGPQGDAFAEAMTDRIGTVFGNLAPPLDTAASPCLTLSQAGAGIERWDLSEPAEVKRPFRLRLNPFDAEGALSGKKQQRGMNSLVRVSDVPPLTLGIFTVRVLTDLPSELTGVFSLRVTLEPISNGGPAIAASADVTRAADINLNLQVGLLEELRYRIRTSAVFQLPDDLFPTLHRESPRSVCTEPFLSLGPADFPVFFVETSARFDLLERADIQGTCRAMSGACGTIERTFSLTQSRPSATVVLPNDAVGVVREIDIIALDGSGKIHLSVPAQEVCSLALSSLPGYGSHRVEIKCAFPSGSDDAATLELLPECANTGRSCQVKVLSKVTSTIWTYRADTPFRPGFRYRWLGTESWSAVQSPFAPLRISAPVTAGRVGGTP